MRKLLYLDTETTGLQNPRLLQLGLNVDMRNAHNAYTDVLAVRELFKRQVMSIICKNPEAVGFMQKMMAITRGEA
jgi:DNA polymerase III epsilon subunit-like protein